MLWHSKIQTSPHETLHFPKKYSTRKKIVSFTSAYQCYKKALLTIYYLITNIWRHYSAFMLFVRNLRGWLIKWVKRRKRILCQLVVGRFSTNWNIDHHLFFRVFLVFHLTSLHKRSRLVACAYWVNYIIYLAFHFACQFKTLYNLIFFGKFLKKLLNGANHRIFDSCSIGLLLLFFFFLLLMIIYGLKEIVKLSTYWMPHRWYLVLIFELMVNETSVNKAIQQKALHVFQNERGHIRWCGLIKIRFHTKERRSCGRLNKFF